MTATEELRRLLDERGVEWSSPSGVASSFADSITFIGNVAVVSEIDGSDLLRINFDGTPEQAIAATLGRGECRAVSMRELHKRPFLNDEQVCSECGCQLAHEFGRVWQNYCPNCGRKVVES